MDESHELPPGFIERLMEAVKQKKQTEEEKENQSFKEDEQEEIIGNSTEQFPPNQQIHNNGESKQILNSQSQQLLRNQLLKKSMALVNNPIFRFFKKQALAPQIISTHKVISEKKKTQKELFDKEIARLQQKRKQVQETAKRQNQKNLIFQRELKLYFENHLTRVLNKLEENTDDKFKEIYKKLDKLESYCEFKSKRQDFQHRQPPPRKKKIYIRNGEKLSYVNKIERKELTPRQAAALLNTTEKNVQGWISHKESLLQKQQSRRQKDTNGTIDYDNLEQIMF